MSAAKIQGVSLETPVFVHYTFFTKLISMKKTSRFRNAILLTVISSLVALPLVGCGDSGELSAVTDNADAEKLAEFDRIEAEEESEEESEGDE